MDLPSVGRIVHYLRRRDNSRCLAAMITDVDPADSETGVELRVFGGTEDFVAYSPLEPSARFGRWHWPESGER